MSGVSIHHMRLAIHTQSGAGRRDHMRRKHPMMSVATRFNALTFTPRSQGCMVLLDNALRLHFGCVPGQATPRAGVHGRSSR